MRYMVERNFVSVVGRGWYGQPMAYEYPLHKHDLENIGEFTRENVEEWLTTHSRDFQVVDGWYATAGDKELPWMPEDAEVTYQELMWPSGDEE